MSIPTKQKKRLDDETDWSGTFSGTVYRIVYDPNTGSQTQYVVNTYTFEKVGIAAYQGTTTFLEKTETHIGLAFKYCDGTRSLLLVDTDDETEQVCVATSLQNNQVHRFQNTLVELTTKNETNPAFVGFVTAERKKDL